MVYLNVIQVYKHSIQILLKKFVSLFEAWVDWVDWIIKYLITGLSKFHQIIIIKHTVVIKKYSYCISVVPNAK